MLEQRAVSINHTCAPAWLKRCSGCRDCCRLPTTIAHPLRLKHLVPKLPTMLLRSTPTSTIHICLPSHSSASSIANLARGEATSSTRSFTARMLAALSFRLGLGGKAVGRAPRFGLHGWDACTSLFFNGWEIQSTTLTFLQVPPSASTLTAKGSFLFGLELPTVHCFIEAEPLVFSV